MEIAQKQVIELPIDSILPNRFQPRIKYDENQIYELSESIKTHGVIQPILVRQLGDKYEIVAGERRYKASLLAGKQTIPAVIRNMSDKDSMEIALAENVQRVDLTPIEEAISYKKVLDKGEMTQDELARKLGKNQSTIANKIRLLNLDEEVQEALLENKISERHARSLLKLKTRKDQVDLLNKIIIERLTVRKLDEEIEKILNKKEVPNEVIIDNYEVSDEVLDIPTMPVIIDEEIEGDNMNNNINQDTNAQLAQNTMLNSTVINSDENNIFIDNTKVQDPYENIDTILNNAQQINVEKPLNDVNKLLTPDEITKEEVEQPKFKEGKFFNIPNNIEVEEKEEEPNNFDFTNTFKQTDNNITNEYVYPDIFGTDTQNVFEDVKLEEDFIQPILNEDNNMFSNEISSLEPQNNIEPKDSLFNDTALSEQQEIVKTEIPSDINESYTSKIENYINELKNNGANIEVSTYDLDTMVQMVIRIQK